MELNITELMKSTMVLFAVIDIIGSIPVLRKVFGIILLSIAVKLFTSNVQNLI
tara:strand:- start:386 stop:544 length:159 start_codon:yes stop_codon:yes gene_type:complete